MQFGVNAWVWTSPLTTKELESLAPKVAGMGFDWIEIPLEGLDDLEPSRGKAIVRDHGLGVSTCAAMGPDRDLVHPDPAIQLALHLKQLFQHILLFHKMTLSMTFREVG